MIDKRWTILPTAEQHVQHLQEILNIHPALCRVLALREINSKESAKDFFRPDWSQLHNPFEMQDMEQACKRIEEAVQKKQKILFYGDYDVDGTTSVSLLLLFFKSFYEHITYYIPDRYKEGYGVSMQGISWAVEQGVSLIITIDCGVTAHEQIAFATSHGIDVIVCDHHNPSETLPNACAVLNPKRSDCNYPYKELSGCGIGFKLCQALCIKLHIPEEQIRKTVDLVALSIASDIVPITGENRVLAFFGLKKIEENPLPSIEAALKNTALRKNITISDLVFVVGPKINAPGRMAHARSSVELLISPNVKDATEKFQVLLQHNFDRKETDLQTFQEALQIIAENPALQQKKSTVLYDPSWHKGVVGIVASRLIEKYYKPTIVLAEEDGVLTGSARSIKGFNMYDGLAACSDLLLKFGGHNFAAGLSVAKENVTLFAERFEKICAEKLSDEMLIPEIEIDAELELKWIHPKFYQTISQMHPFGPGNMRPVFYTKRLRDAGSRLVGNNHLKVEVMDEQGVRKSGIAYQMADKLSVIKNNAVDICYVIEENTFRGETSLQLNIRDIRLAQ